VVIGSSIGYFVRPPRTHPAQRNYAEQLEQRLRDAGIDAVVTNSSRWTSLVSDCLRNVEPLVLQHRPHVVVVNLGLLECEPKVIPWAAFRWIFTMRARGGVRLSVRTLLADPARRFYIWYSPRVLRRVRIPHRVSPARFEWEIGKLVRVVRHDRAALVLLMNINPPGPALEAVLPGTSAAAEQYNSLLARVAASESSGVEIADVAALAIEHDASTLSPDGIHYSLRGHQLVGDLLADRIIPRAGCLLDDRETEA
jgi:lysophospholipase L1-like esterase